MSTHDVPDVPLHPVAARLAQIEDEIHAIILDLEAAFDGPTTDLVYCRYNLQDAALRLAFAGNRIKSPSGSDSSVVPQ